MTPDRRALDLPSLFGLGGIGVLLAGIGVLARDSRRTIDRSSRAVLAENVASLRAVADLELALLDQKGILADFLLDPDPKSVRLLEERWAGFERWFDAARGASFAEPERRIVDRIDALFTDYDRLRVWVLALSCENRAAEAALLYTEEIGPRVEELQGACGELRVLNERLLAEAQSRNAAKLARLEAGIWAAIGAALLLGGLLASLHYRRATRRILEAEKFATLGQMAGLFAHEIRTPLTALRLRLHSLLQGTVNPADIEAARRETERVDRVVRSLLDSARATEPRREPRAVADLLSDALATMRPALERQGVLVEERIEEALPAVRADAELLRHALVNLLRNAAEAMPSGGGLSIVARRVPGRRGSPEQVEIALRDTGSGIPADRRRQVFEPFFTTKEKGTGLGLALVRRILESHGGTIAVEGEEGAGATFVLRLPAFRVGASVA
ncbi:MAG: ATP-binding protein [Planctomycetes bacterium]|nr:ATP-binding protein [Planctomycetota bacterium]